MIDLGGLLADLRAEGDQLDSWVADLGADQWRAPTPAAGWSVAHQVAHLAWTDERALLSATDPDGFIAETTQALAGGDPQQFVDKGAADGAQLPPDELLARWRELRVGLAGALAGVPAGAKLLWYGPPMSPASMATARIMETWAHAGDVADALGIKREPTERIRHVAHLGVRTRDFAYLVRAKAVPTEQFRVELVGPGGGVWVWGPEDAAQRVSGSAWDFCRLVTQRVHRDDTDLVAVGADADEWLGIAQAFAGPPGEGRAKA
ncbi:TIGR03084 family metal-binding protein [Actinokineospora sp. NBRC 105648]|uniref:TIGR03084 family metal-binding protein n=1 Tax=Actinokineospora sp. NBRC 105648 TaxID=3032206 RepID=UPI0025549BC8|nr:TIGR03084 family metal-binding protein [Actinokineospora sp. NBRC 105648]